ncbi:MAG: ABC transporter permease [Desulfobacter sp.]|nr:ABC transporter permease [Desulfobacter sp.]WDP85187.1 MAG: ABC transporter permease [Desulfobacter sp.]
MNFLTLVLNEIKTIFSNSYVLLTVFGGVVFYSFLYPLPYANQVPKEQPIAVVNHDKSLLSYQLERMADATDKVKIHSRCQSLEQAKDLFFKQEVSGILVIPANFYKDILLGKSPTLAYAGDASYFLVFGAIAQGITQAQATLGAQIKIMDMVKHEPMVLAKTQYAPVHINAKPCFNPTMGYVHYVVPAVFILLLHQTLIMAAGIITATPKKTRPGLTGNLKNPGRLKLILARTLVFSAIYLVLSLYCFGWSFNFYQISCLARPLDLMIFLTPFLISVCFAGILTGIIVPSTEYVIVLVLISSMPLVFSAGFIWPLESLPQSIVWLSNLVPSTPGIQGFLALNQLGATLEDVRPLWCHLWLLCLGWGTACFLACKKVYDPTQRRQR